MAPVFSNSSIFYRTKYFTTFTKLLAAGMCNKCVFVQYVKNVSKIDQHNILIKNKKLIPFMKHFMRYLGFLKCKFLRFSI